MCHAEDDNDSETNDKPKRSPSPLGHASCISRWFFVWAWPLLELGSQRPLEEDDLTSLLEEDTSGFNRQQLQDVIESWRRRTNTHPPNHQDHSRDHDQIHNNHTSPSQPPSTPSTSLFRVLCINYFKDMWFAQVLLVISMLARIGQVLALQVLLDHLEGNNRITSASSATTAYTSAAVMIVCGAIVFMTKQQQFFITYRRGMQLRIGLVASIYHKAFHLPSVNSVSAGQAVNLASNDVERFLMATVTGMYVVWGPLEALLILGIGIYIIGGSFAAGFGLFMTLLLPLQFYLSQLFAKLRLQVATETDARVNLVSQAITGARVMKMNAWEYQFEQRIADCRAREMAKIVRSCRYKGLNESLYFFSSLVVSVFIFLVHIWTGGVLTAGTVFSTLTLVNILQYTMTKIFPMAIMFSSECYISCRRIQDFLLLPELSSLPPSTTKSTENDGNNNNNIAAETPEQVVMSLKNVVCHWGQACSTTITDSIHSNSLHSSSSPTPPVALENVSISFQSASLYGIMGVVGSGKSALIQALVGEIPVSSGDIQRHYTSLAYAPQDPWIMNGSIRDNILLGLPFQAEWYEKVVKACALQDDILHFQHGDSTLLGDKGVQCSGGQRARIGLARAVYRDAQVWVLDDPMSAVDTKIGRWIYRETITGLGVNRGKCVILATHQLPFLETATECFLMDHGHISCRGSYQDCIIAAHGAPLSETAVHKESNLSTENGDDELVTQEEDKENNDVTDKTIALSKSGKNEVKEDRRTGVVKLSTWVEYADAMGGLWIAGGLFLLFTITQASSLVSQVAIGKWAEQPAEQQDSPTSLCIILGLTALTVFISVDRAILSYFFFNRASQRLHDRMTHSVLFSQMSFFDTNPSGRLLNRFSADVGIADEQLPLSLYDCMVGLFMAFGSVATAISVLPIILVTLPPLLWYLFSMRRVFVSTTRELKRLEGLGRSPIFEMIGEALHGIATIRSNSASSYFLNKFEVVHDAHTRAYFAFVACSRWFATRLEFVTFILMAAASLASALIYDQGWFNVDPAVLGLALTLLLQLAGTNFPWMVRQSAEVVNQMVSVERVVAYGELPSEAAVTTELDAEHAGWPTKASISFQDLTVRYQKNLPISLKCISVKFVAGEKIGIVGKSGSGKSTLVQALFRLLEAEEGSIFIDDVDIAQLGLHKLRLAMSVIPQVPVLFRGCSVRANLDPFDAYTDEEIWSVLDDVQMTKVVKNLVGGLDAMILSEGSNFSVGQRQLLCLARAILKKSRILVLDEATANIDLKTEGLLKEALTRNFSQATVIAVAHRLDTVKDYDKILVMGEARVLEFGPPNELLLKEKGHYKSLVAAQKQR